MNIEWREINADYIVSSDGQIGSRKGRKLRMLRPDCDKQGYRTAAIYCNGKKSRPKVHQLVAEAFLGPKPTPAHQVNHKNGVKSDNMVGNLEWVTASQNNHHRYDVLGVKALRGGALPQTKLTEADVREIRRRCKAGELYKIIAADHGITLAYVGEIANRKKWAWLDAEAHK